MSVKETPMIRPIGDSKKSSGFAQDDLNQIRDHFATENKIPWCWLFFGGSITHGALEYLEMAKEIFRKFDIYDPEANSCNPVGIPFSIAPINERI